MSPWSSFLPYPRSRNNRPRSVQGNELASASESTLPPETAVPLYPSTTRTGLGDPRRGHLPRPLPQIRNLAEEWIPFDIEAGSKLRGYAELNKSNLEPAVLFSQITNNPSHEPDAEFVKTVNDLQERANNQFLKEIPRLALAQAYAHRALTHGEDFEMMIVDSLTSLQLFPSGDETRENTEEMNARNLMLNMLKALSERNGLLDGVPAARSELRSTSGLTWEPEAAVPLNFRSRSPGLGPLRHDHRPHPPPQVRHHAEEWIPFDTKAGSKLRGCPELNKSNLEPAVLFSQITNNPSHEPDAEFVKTVNDLQERANNQFLKEIPRLALAQAYAHRALTHGEDFEMMIVDFLTSLQLFPSGDETRENTEEMNARNLMLNTLKALYARNGLLEGVPISNRTSTRDIPEHEHVIDRAELGIPTFEHPRDIVSDRTPTPDIPVHNHMIDSAEPGISTFVVLMPESGYVANDPTAICLEDVNILEEYVTNGGNAHSTHRPVDAENWVELNYDSILLKSLRTVGLGGPLATMLSIDMPALAIFGSFLDDRVLELAQMLSEASALPVMIRPAADNPITIFSQSSSFHAPLGVDTDSDCEMDGGSESENPSSESDADEDDGTDLPTDKVFRFRGGSTRQDRKIQPNDTSDYIGPKGIERPDDGLHRTNINLHLHLDENYVYDVEISSETLFKFQTHKAETADPLTESLSRSQVLSCVDLKVEMRPFEGCVDRSYSNVGFLVHQPKYIADREYLSRGFERPTAKATRGTQTSTQTTGSLAVGLESMNPTLTATASRSHTTGVTVQWTDEKAAPPCEVKSQVGKKWDSDGKCYSSYDVAWYPANDPNGIPHSVDFRFGMGIKFYGKPERCISRLPQISHILRNQIIMWIHDPGLKAKVRGMIILTTTYIPDITISEPLSILEDQEVNLERSPAPPPEETTSLGHNAANSVAIGLFEEPKENVKTGMRKLIQKFAPKSSRQKSKKPDLIDLPLHEYVARGWDHTNQMWRNTVWPTLDRGFRDVPHSSAAWNLNLKQAGTTEGGGVVEDTEPARLSHEHGDDELTRRTSHPATEYSGVESGSSSGSNVEGVHVILPPVRRLPGGMAGSSTHSGSDGAQVTKPLA
ncbi:hypothetical protein C8R45DRAFT_1046037 [Mycena sanguinolenta]|nr:hypothetical protein C8R45DRAFT_1046037 [Mycena sanguinolenta]